MGIMRYGALMGLRVGAAGFARGARWCVVYTSKKLRPPMAPPIVLYVALVLCGALVLSRVFYELGIGVWYSACSVIWHESLNAMMEFVCGYGVCTWFCN